MSADNGWLGPLAPANDHSYPQETRIPDPGVGLGFTYTVDGDHWERGLALAFLLTAGADDNVSSVTVKYLDQDGVIIAEIDLNASPDPSTALQYSLLPTWNGARTNSNGIVSAHLPAFFMQPTWRIVVTVSGTFTEGALTNIRYYRERFLTGPPLET